MSSNSVLNKILFGDSGATKKEEEKKSGWFQTNNGTTTKKFTPLTDAIESARQEHEAAVKANTVDKLLGITNNGDMTGSFTNIITSLASNPITPISTLEAPKLQTNTDNTAGSVANRVADRLLRNMGVDWIENSNPKVSRVMNQTTLPDEYVAKRYGTTTDNGTAKNVETKKPTFLTTTDNGTAKNVETKKPTFLEASISKKLENPNSELSKKVKEEVRNNVYRFLLSNNKDTLKSPVSEAGLGSWMSGETEEYNKAMQQKNVSTWTNMREMAKNLGVFNEDGDYSLYNQEGIRAERARLNIKKNYLVKEYEKYNNSGPMHLYDTGEGGWTPDPVQLMIAAGTTEQKAEARRLKAELQQYDPNSEEYKKAKKEMDELAAVAIDFSQNIYPQYEMLFAEDEEGMMRLAYDALNGRGAYDRDTAKMLKSNKEELDKRLRNAVGFNLREGSAEKRYIEQEIKTVNSRMDQLDKYEQMINEYGQLMGNASSGESGYNPEYDKAIAWYQNEEGEDLTGLELNQKFIGKYPNGISTADKIYSYINGGREYQAWASYTGNDVTQNSQYKNVEYMLQKEKEKFTVLYNEDVSKGLQPEQAMAFLEGLQPYLTERRRPYEESYNKSQAKRLPVSSTISDVMSSLAAVPYAATVGIGKLAGESWAEDPYGAATALARYQKDTEEQVSKEVGGGTAGKLYRAFVGGLKNAVRGAASTFVTGGVGTAAEVGTLINFFAEDYVSTYQDKLEKTRDADASALYAFVDAGISTFFEVASVESMMGDPSNYFNYWLKSVIAEQSEELNEGVFGPYIHKMLDGSMEWEERAGEIMMDGGYYNDQGQWVKIKNREDAWKQSMSEWNQQTLDSIMSAGLTAGGQSLYGIGRSMANEYKTGSQVLENGTEKEADNKTKTKNEVGSLVDLLDGADLMKDGTQSKKLAGEIQNDLEKGNISRRKVGQLVQSMSAESNNQFDAVANTVLKNAIRKDLEESGVKNVDKMTNLVLKMATGEDMNMRERLQLEMNQTALNIAKEYYAGYQMGLVRDKSTTRTEEALTEIYSNPNVKQAQETMATVRAIMYEDKTEEQRNDNISKIVQGAETATRDEMKEAEGEATGDTKEVIADGKVAEITGLQRVQEQDPTDPKKKVTRLKVQLAYKTDGGKDTVDISQVKATNQATAQVLQYANMDGNSTLSDNFIMTMLDAAKDVKDGINLLKEAGKIAWNTALGITKTRTSLDAATQEKLEKAAQADKEAAEQETAARGRAINPGKGTTEYNGVYFGTKNFKEALKDIDDKEARKDAYVIGELASAMGADVHLKYDTTDTDNQGFYYGPDGITINLAGEYAKGIRRSGVATLSHEFWHNMRANSNNAANAYQRFVFSWLEKEGRNIRGDLMGIMRNYKDHGEELNIYGAMEELTAMASEEMLTNEKVVRTVKEQDPAMYGDVQENVRKVINMVSSVLDAVKGTSNRFARDLRDYADLMGNLWLDVYAEAKEYKNEGEQQTRQNVSLPFKENYAGAEEQEQQTTERQSGDIVDQLLTGNRVKTVPTFKENYAGMNEETSTEAQQKETHTAPYKAEFEEKYAGMEEQEGQTAEQQENIVDKLMNNRVKTVPTFQEKYAGQGEESMHSYKDDLDARYAEAVENKDWETAEEMLLEKAQNTPGVTGYKAAHFYNGEHKDIARAIKDNYGDTVAVAVEEMAPMVPKNAVLIPMPPHEGTVTEDTDTMILAKALSEATGAPVVTALESDYHPSRYEAKATGDRSVNAQTMGFRQIAKIDDDAMPVFVDNMVGGGQTAIAAKNAIGRGITLAYAQSARGKSQGVKALTVTYDKDGNLIPLSQRMDVNNKSWKYSFKEEDIIRDQKKYEGKTLYENEDVYGYDFLTSLHPIKEIQEGEISKVTDENGNIDDSKLADIGMENAINEAGGIKDGNAVIVQNEYTGRNMVITRHGIVHSVHTDNNSTNQANARVAQKAGMLAKYAVPINGLTNESDATGTYAMAAPVLGENGIMEKVAILTVEVRTGNVVGLEVYDQLHAASARKKNEARKTRSARSNGSTANTRSYRINITDFLEEINSTHRGILSTSVLNKFGEERPMNGYWGPRAKFSFKESDEQYMQSVNNGNMEAAQEAVDAYADKNGYTIRAFHGTGRADRVGTVFLPERATSGPMAFFTDSREIAENYSKDKKDTSITYDEDYGDYHTQFRYNLNGKNIPVEKLWDKLGWKSRQRIIEAGKHINFDEEMEDIIYDENAKYGPGGFTENELRYHRGNAIDTLIYVWLDSANLWGREGDFIKIMEMAGIKGVTWNDPDARVEKVYDTYLKIQNPFIVNDMYTEGFLQDLQEWWDEQEQDKYVKEDLGADFWDKNGITVDEWIEHGYRDIENGTTHNWTRIPDGVTAYLKEKGYDGIKDQGGKNGGAGHTVWIPFTSEQIKSAETITYDDDGNIIPPSERFNTQKKDIRWSIQDESDQDIRSWMMTVKPETLQNDAERALLKHWQEMNTKVELKAKQIHELQMKIAQMKEMVRKDDFKNNSKDAQRKIREWTVQLENARTVRDQAMAELNRIESEEGYGEMLKAQNRRFNEFQSGKTQAEVAEEIGNLQKASAKISEEITAAAKRIAEIEKKGAIEKLKKILGTTTSDQTAAELKKEFSSSWTKGQIRNYLDPILIKLANGEDITADVEELAGILISSDTRYTNETLAGLRGLTITLGKGAQKELKAQNSSLKEIRARLAGTGITVKYGDRSTLEADIEDLREQYPDMPEMGSDKDALENFVSWVEGLKRSGADEFYDEQLAEAMAQIYGKVIATAKGIYVPTEAKAQKQVMALVEFVKGLNAETQEAVRTLQEIGKQAQSIFGSGKNASEKAQALIGNMNEALEYYNLSAKLAMQHAKQERNSAIIEQLKSKHAQEIAKRNTEWRELMERDAEARKTAESIRGMQSRMNTALKRIYRLLKNPKGLQNIPQPVQGLARTLLQMFVDNDLAEGYRTKLTLADRNQLEDAKRVLAAMEAEDGPYDPLDLQGAEEAVQAVAAADIITIQGCIDKLSQPIEGKNRLDKLQQKAQILNDMAEAVTEIYRMIRKEGQINIRDRQIAVEDQADKIMKDTGGKRYREWTGTAGTAIRALHRAIVSGNMTPEYFFRFLGNEGLSELWENYHDAENRNGLALKAAKDRLAEIAEKYGYDKWDMKQKITLKLENGDVEVTLGQLMSLWATWKRETAQKEAMTQHLTEGGFYAAPDLQSGILGRQAFEKKATRIRATQNEDGTWESKDMALVESLLTDEQLKFIDDVISYMSNEMSELGNEASLKAYGIRLYKEKYYFPFQVWNGVKSQKSNESGVNAGQDRAFHQSFTYALTHKAKNAIMMSDFMDTATEHITGMINYATMGLANENLQKVLNVQLYENVDTEGFSGTKRNLKAILEEAYGKEAMQYLNELKTQLNGGAVRTRRTVGDKAVSLFRKNAVAGSLSVAMQQPLSYLRAAMLIKNRYLSAALMKEYWKDSYKERMEHSGVSVIKEMGRFDMNLGQSAREYIKPEGKTNNVKKAWGQVTEKSTILPELMDRWTWNRIWVAVKAEQHAEHPEMDVKSDEFLDMCGERFNEVMRRTQVYDSVLVKSANMRSDHYFVKNLTSFMAEPTVTMNVLADAVRMAVKGEKGGLTMVRKAAEIYLIGAIIQAAVKGGVGAGRNPDEDKTLLENFLYRFWANLLNELDPLGMIPGYSDLITLMKKGELSDDAMGAVGKIFTAKNELMDLMLGNSKKDLWRGLEDSIGQIVQLFSNLPLKNISRDTRAIFNYITQPYAKREDSAAVIKYQAIDAFMNADNLVGVINQRLKESGYGYDTSATGYKKRVYNAMKEGNEAQQKDYIEYLLKGKGVKDEKSIWTGVSGFIKEDYENGGVSREEAENLMKQAKPDLTDKKLMETLDEIDYEKEIGEEVESYSNYTRLKNAFANRDDKAYRKEKEYLIKNGYKESDVTSEVKSWIKSEYKAGTITRTQAEAMYKKYDPNMDKKDIAKALDEIDYEKKKGVNVDNYSIYTPLHDAIMSNNKTEYSAAKKHLQSIGYEENTILTEVESYIKKLYKEGNITKAAAESRLKEYRKDMTANDIFWTLDRLEYTKQTGKDAGSGMYYRLKDAINANKSAEIKNAVNQLMTHGITKDKIKGKLSDWKKSYLAAKGAEKIRIKNALIIAYKAIGYTENQANEIINKWK